MWDFILLIHGVCIVLFLFLRLIEAQEGTREIRKLNHIMKTKDARIENLETK